MACEVCGQFRGRKASLNCGQCSEWAKRTFVRLTKQMKFGTLLRHICPEQVEVSVVECDL